MSYTVIESRYDEVVTSYTSAFLSGAGVRNILLQNQCALDLSDHLEIETYTWDVLPAHLKTGDITDYVTRELEWLRDTLLAMVRVP